MNIQGVIYLLIALVVIGVLYGLVQYVVRAIPIPDPLGRVIMIVAAVVACLAAIILLVQFAQGVAIVPIR